MRNAFLLLFGGMAMICSVARLNVMIRHSRATVKTSYGTLSRIMDGG